MNMNDRFSEWTVNAIAVSFIKGKRVERNLEDLSAEEKKEIARRVGDRAMRAAGYIRVPNKESRDYEKTS